MEHINSLTFIDELILSIDFNRKHVIFIFRKNINIRAFHIIHIIFT